MPRVTLHPKTIARSWHFERSAVGQKEAWEEAFHGSLGAARKREAWLEKAGCRRGNQDWKTAETSLFFFGGGGEGMPLEWRQNVRWSQQRIVLIYPSVATDCQKKTTYNQAGTHSNKNQPSRLRNFTSLERLLIPDLPDPPEEAPASGLTIQLPKTWGTAALAHTAQTFPTVCVSMKGSGRCKSPEHKAGCSLTALPTSRTAWVPRRGGWGLLFWFLHNRKPLPM